LAGVVGLVVELANLALRGIYKSWNIKTYLLKFK
jgi:hypothetical protein